jgi:hypothetical protein
VTYDGVVRLQLIWLALEPSRLSRSALMNVPFELSTSLMKIYRTQNDHEHLTNSKPPAQNQNGRRTFLTLLSPLRTLLTQDLTELCDPNVVSVQGRARLIQRTPGRRIGTSLRPMLSSPTISGPLPNHQ